MYSFVFCKFCLANGRYFILGGFFFGWGETITRAGANLWRRIHNLGTWAAYIWKWTAGLIIWFDFRLWDSGYHLLDFDIPDARLKVNLFLVLHICGDCSLFVARLEICYFFLNVRLHYGVQENGYWLDRLLRAYQSRAYTGDLIYSMQVRMPTFLVFFHWAWKSISK